MRIIDDVLQGAVTWGNLVILNMEKLGANSIAMF